MNLGTIHNIFNQSCRSSIKNSNISLGVLINSMGLKKLLGDAKSKYREIQEKKYQEKLAHESYANIVNKLLDEFTIPQFNKFFKNYLGEMIPKKYHKDNDGRETIEMPVRKDYVEFVWNYLNDDEITYEQLKKYTLKEKMVSLNFFQYEDEDEYEENEFEEIINSIKNNFEPEKIADEEHLESQLIIYLKTKFPDKKIIRQVSIIRNDILDILIDDKYAIELKVPTTRSHLRNLGAQLEEYRECYPAICAVIFDAEEYNLTQDIIDYSDKFKQNYEIPCIILNGRRR